MGGRTDSLKSFLSTSPRGARPWRFGIVAGTANEDAFERRFMAGLNLLVT
jgi:hypothetical protein